MSVFVLDKHHQALMPCSEKRARLLLNRGRAVVHRRVPFTIRLKDRLASESQFQPVALKLDPGSRTTGIAIARVEVGRPTHHALHLAELEHKQVHPDLVTRATARRGRRARHTRYRPPRFNNRRRGDGWLPPSLTARLDEIDGWVNRYLRWCPVTHLSYEAVHFDMQALENPEISGLEYQRGTLLGFEIGEYLLLKWGHHCAYCGITNVPLEKEHIIPQSRGGSNRVSNLTLACHACNQAKGDQTATEFGYPAIQAQAKHPLHDAAAVNTTRRALHRCLLAYHLPISAYSGGRTRYNRTRLGLPKTHAADALCVGELEAVTHADAPVLHIKTTGRGRRFRTLLNRYGFPRAYLPRQKRYYGFTTGDLVRAIVPAGKHQGTHLARVAVRATGRFRVGSADGIAYRYCQLLQRADGYEYTKGVQAVPPQH
jgi:5-methylcytosine-specific restriction endonuclease McrA